jgi:hypothetical protein
MGSSMVRSAISRLPEVPEWNEDGLRMELFR